MFGRILLAFMECFGIYKRQVRVGDIYVGLDAPVVTEILGMSDDRVNYLVMFTDGSYYESDGLNTDYFLDENFFYYLGNIND